MLGNQPVIKILKRPPNLVSPEQVNGINSCNVKPQPVVKSLQQREMEYAEARLRIFGTSETDEKLRNSKNELNDVPKRIIKPARKDNVIRYPRGPDGTKGFHLKIDPINNNYDKIAKDYNKIIKTEDKIRFLTTNSNTEKTRHRENVANIECVESESDDQFNLVSNGFLDSNG